MVLENGSNNGIEVLIGIVGVEKDRGSSVSCLIDLTKKGLNSHSEKTILGRFRNIHDTGCSKRY